MVPSGKVQVNVSALGIPPVILTSRRTEPSEFVIMSPDILPTIAMSPAKSSKQSLCKTGTKKILLGKIRFVDYVRNINLLNYKLIHF